MNFLRWLFPRLFYRAEWDAGRLYGFARRSGGVIRRVPRGEKWIGNDEAASAGNADRL